MGYIKNIKLVNYRNFINSDYSFKKGCNIIIGKNGSGKTNILEAISLFRKEKIDNLINFDPNKKNFKIESIFFHNQTEYNIAISNTIKNIKNTKKILINDSSDIDDYVYFEKLLPIIYFLPEMERLFTSSPSVRRNFLDRLIYTNDKKYNLLINNYKVFQPLQEKLKHLDLILSKLDKLLI